MNPQTTKITKNIMIALFYQHYCILNSDLTEFIVTKQNQCWIYVTENRGTTANIGGSLTKIVIYNYS